MTHICVSKLHIVDSDYGWVPDRHQAIIWTNAGILLIQASGTISIFIHKNAFENICEIAAILSRPQCVETSCNISHNEKAVFDFSSSPIANAYEKLFWAMGSVCEIVFAEVIDHRSRVRMIHHRPTVYTCRPVTLSSSKTHEYSIDRLATRLDSLPSPTQFLPRSGPRSMGKVAHCGILKSCSPHGYWNF